MAFADTTDLAEYLGIDEDDLPADASRQLDRASELVEYATFNNYDSSIATHVEAVKKATCAQVEFWINIGESTAIVGNTLKGYKSGDLSMDFGSNSRDNSLNKLSARSTLYLAREGLLYRGVSSKCVCHTPYF